MVAVGKDAVPMPEALIRPMREDDVEDVLRIEQSSYAFPWTQGIFRDCLRVGYRCNVLELGCVVAGYSVLGTGAGEAHLLNLCVRDEFRFRGLGRMLLQHMLGQARTAGARIIILETRTSNLAAIRLYQSQGFVQIGVRKGYYQARDGREDAIVMRLPLDGEPP
jgi:ribosomal-protein-alanine N-acetyltransferase